MRSARGGGADRDVGIAERGAHERTGSGRMPPRGDDDHLVDAEILRERRYAGGVLHRVPGGRVADQAHVGPLPCVAHQLGLCEPRAVPRPAREDDRVGAVGELLGVPEPEQAERMEAVHAARRVAEDRDEPLRLSAGHAPASAPRR